MRGLSSLFSDVRNCQNKEQERLRADKGLENIRTRFKNEKERRACGWSEFLFMKVFTDLVLLLQ
ncbi:hypothetical protein ACS0TY_009400 [Phlomoides rotata]